MAAGERIGVMACWSCKKQIPVKKTAAGNLSAPCSWCDFYNSARPGTGHHARLLADVTLDPKEPDKPAPKGGGNDYGLKR